MNAKNLFGIIALFFVLSIRMTAQSDVIDAKDFAGYVKLNPSLIIIDASKPDLYAKAHLKGAINLPYKELNQKEGKVEGLMESVENMAKIFGEKGIGENDPVLVYDEGSQKYSTRVFWLLKYLGATNVKLLHKDNNKWRDARITLTSEPTKLKAKTFNPKVNSMISVGLAEISELLTKPDVVIIDAREMEEYSGTETGDKAYSKGHLPKAINIPFNSLLNEDNSYKSAEIIKKIHDEKGLTADKTYIVYCKTGVKASVNFIAMTDILKYPNVKLYDGGYVEWEFNGKAIEK
ncbi:MAG: sulfurtransferase [Deltaproteobacteria bacterium]